MLAELLAVGAGRDEIDVSLLDGGEAGLPDLHDGAGLELLLQDFVGGFVQHGVNVGDQLLRLEDLLIFGRMTNQ